MYSFYSTSVGGDLLTQTSSLAYERLTTHSNLNLLTSITYVR